MAADRDGRTEPATARKRREAERAGTVARSRDLTSLATLVAAVLMVIAGAPFWLERVLTLARYGLDAAVLSGRREVSILPIMNLLVQLTLPLVGILALVAVLVSGLYTGWHFATGAIAPKPERLSPAENMARIFSRRTVVELAKSILKLTVLFASLALILSVSLPTLVRLPMVSSMNLPAATLQLFAGFFALIIAPLAVITVFDVWYQRVEYARELRMTREEIRKERREDQGDPQLRARRREIQRDTGES